MEVWNYDEAFDGPFPIARFDSGRVDVVANWDKIKPQGSDVSLEKGFGDGERTQALVARAGHLLGPAGNKTVEEATGILLAWNQKNTPPLDEAKVRSTVASLGKAEAKKREAVGGTGELPKLPYGYKWNARGQMTTQVPIKSKEKGEAEKVEWEEVELTEFPLFLTAVSRKERELKQAYFFKQWLPKEGWREFQVLCEDFEGTAGKGRMASNGGHCILNDKLFKNYVHAHDSQLRREHMDTIRYQQFGWKNEETAFLVGDVLIHNTGRIEKAMGSEELGFRMKQMTPTPRGSLAAWSAEANCLFGDAYIHLGYALVASFASVLLKLCMDESDGGIVLSIVSEKSGRGKSKIIEAAASVWGQLEASQITPRDTVNAKLAIITMMGHLPTFMDEHNERDPHILAGFIKQFTVGHDKNRAQRDGTVVSKPAEYKTLLMSCSNNSLLEIVRASNDEGAIARVLEIRAPALDREQTLRLGQIIAPMAANAGHAGREFIYQIMQPGELDKVRAELALAVNHFRENLNTYSEHRYVAWLPAAVLVAAGVLRRSGILEFDPKRLMEWSLKHAMERVNNPAKASAPEILSTFMSEHAGQCLMVSGPFVNNLPLLVLNNMGNIPSRIVMRSERDTKRLFVVSQVIRAWCLKQGISGDDLAGELVKRGIVLKRDRYITLGAGTPASTGRQYCWEVDMTHDAMSGVEIVPPVTEGERK